ncbi:hypothetical protein [Bacillus sp. MRMR6]|uniref:hypothetical protein n=1 Tax=Bacillus sp. MRMR6 TaxID=1928617 RepID=UPI0009534AAD|nr:hypothetical protein [Bacillus sp. MRMR6]OLS33964.1 hypothetical protein BTR25_23475 [Bacillus sp. MRMR6]
MSRRYRPPKGIIIGSLLVFSVITVFLLVRWSLFSPGKQVKEVVEEFYSYEQAGDFAQSWGLFHSKMKEKFSKGPYIQDRAHVFMNHFGVETFDFELGEPEELKKWNLSKEGPEMKEVFKIPVTQIYKGKYGNFTLHQEVFVIKEKDQWKIAWDYNQ